MQRILSRTEIDLETGCWRWPGAKNSNSYAVVGAGRAGTGMVYVHRVVYEELVGPIEHEIDHVHARGCRYRDCHNPDHLEDVTHKENTRRRFAHA